MCEKTESKKDCLKCEVEETKKHFKQSLEINNNRLCELFENLFKKLEYESSGSHRA